MEEAIQISAEEVKNKAWVTVKNELVDDVNAVALFLFIGLHDHAQNVQLYLIYKRWIITINKIDVKKLTCMG